MYCFYFLVHYSYWEYAPALPAAIFVTSSDFIKESPELVQQLIDAHQESIDFINENQDEAIDITIKGIDEVTGQKLERPIMESAWTRTFFESDVDEAVIQAFGDSSYDLKFLKEQPDFSDFVDKQFLN